MKSAAVFILVLTVFSYTVSTASVKDNKPRSRSELEARFKSSANVIVDSVIELLRKYAVEHSLEPMELPDMRQDFSVEIWFVTVDGTLYLTNGWLHDLTTLIRLDEATIQFDDNLVHIRTNVQFNILHLNYDYRVTIMGAEPSGSLTGTADDLQLYIDLTADLDTYKTTLESLSVIKAADINIKVEGSGVEAEILNAISELVEPYFEKDILNFLQDKMKSTLEEALVDFDIHEILG